ncbi:hypothetical protein A9Q84_18450 [Halobacteriovorax marinus]|uniref:ATP-grasp domain-containing protein n=1 Tax=Halobacteriovorax marinus TaxID=97084 RepID=A0A1Y5F1Y6_9BACT|nr:hypothetical protein A9Q84_18450 [Halobacteriovorax marinus]
MKEKLFHIDYNYELELAGSKKQLKGASWFDHIFFFINELDEAILKSDYTFTQDYLNYISSLGVVSNGITSKGASIAWWGNYQDLKLSKLFNSKIEMTKLGLKNDWIPIATTVDPKNISNLEFPIIAREEWGFSGRGSYTFKSRDDFKLPNGRFVLSSKIEKSHDYGITFDLDSKTQFIVENYIDSKGQFKGGRLVSGDHFSKTIGSDNVKLLNVIRNELISLGAKGSIQVDTFSYEKGFHPFVEVNYRKTMGLMVKSLERYFSGEYLAWIIASNKSKTSFEEIRRVISKLENEKLSVKLLSPADRFISFAISSETLEELESTRRELEKLFS